MAKRSIIQVFQTDDVLDTSSLEMLSATSRKVVCVGGENTVVIVEGKGLEISAGMIVQGTITGLVVQSIDGDKQIDISKTSINAAVMSATDMADFLTQTVARIQFENNKYIDSNAGNPVLGSVGNDLLLGRGGDDILQGSFGRDILVGGTGEDTFVFDTGMGRDTIRDFDADNSDGSQDLLDAVFADATITKSGKNTLVDFGDGDAFLLLGVKPGDIDISDFVV
jgi:Ca2+-binding RTX toxin-like protein